MGKRKGYKITLITTKKMTLPEIKQPYAKAIERVFKYMVLKNQMEEQSMIDHMGRLIQIAQAKARELDEQRYDLINKVSDAMTPETISESQKRYA